MIFEGQTEVTDWVYFILKGQCELVNKVKLVRAKSPYRPCQLYTEDSGSSQKVMKEFLDKNYGKKLRKLKKETHHLTVKKLNAGDFFGVGKN